MMTMQIFDPSISAKRGRYTRAAMSDNERQHRCRTRKRADKQTRIAVLDMETDPFDTGTQAIIFPFLAVLYSDDFDPVIIWEENQTLFIEKLIASIENLPDVYTIYAHNGGKFDYMFLLHKLRGFVSFKGRGIMSAKIGKQTLRDSFHIIPEKLASYRKDDFDYTKLTKKRRAKHRDEIIRYCVNDCRYLLDIVKTFVAQHGLKLSIGQAAMAALKASGYEVARLSDNIDLYMRNYFFGGRVECIVGMGHFVGPYKLYDVNSMYPYAMANYQHPIGKEYVIRRGKPGPFTIFLDIECENYGALVCRTPDGETSAGNSRGRFRTSIWEYNVALKYGLIDNVEVIYCVDCDQRSAFDRFVIPLYEKRMLTKKALKELEPNSREYNETKKDDIFYKLLLNNAYGKFAQNPRRFKESYITEIGERPPAAEDFGPLPVIENEALGYAIWERPQKRLLFNNVGTAASITGAARSILLEAMCNAVDPVYCDTDSLICRDLHGVEIHGQNLGAWDIEEEYSEVIIAGKKLYACMRVDGKIKFRSKGTKINKWDDMLRLLDNQIIETINHAPTLTKAGKQVYIKRQVRATAAKPNYRMIERIERVSA